MKDIKKSLKIAGILLIILTILNVALFVTYILAHIYKFYEVEFNWFNTISYLLSIVLSLITAIIYLKIRKLESQEILKKKRLFLILTFLNIFNNVVSWGVTFWIELAVEQQSRKNIYVNPQTFSEETKNTSKYFETENDINSTSQTNRESEIILDENDFKVIHAETLTTRLEELKKLRSKNLISEEEYISLRQEAINNFLD